MCGSSKDLLGWPDLDHAPHVQDPNPVGDVTDHGEVVADEEHGKSATIAQIRQEVEYLCLHGHVEGGNRLVAQQDVGLQNEGACEDNALPLATGQLRRFLQVQVSADSHFFEERSGTSGAIGTRSDPVNVQWFSHLRQNSHARIEGTQRILENVLELAAQATPFLRACLIDAAAQEMNLAITPNEPQDLLCETRFPTAGLANDAECVTNCQIERHIAHGMKGRAAWPTVGDGEIAGGQREVRQGTRPKNDNAQMLCPD